MARPKSIERKEPLTARLYVRLTLHEEDLLYALIKRAKLREKSDYIRGVIHAQARAAGLEK